jgi:hypothetical protein
MMECSALENDLTVSRIQGNSLETVEISKVPVVDMMQRESAQHRH